MTENEKQKEVMTNKDTVERGKKTVKDASELIDKIDDILEKNAEEFVKNYKQKNGE